MIRLCSLLVLIWLSAMSCQKPSYERIIGTWTSQHTNNAAIQLQFTEEGTYNFWYSGQLIQNERDGQLLYYVRNYDPLEIKLIAGNTGDKLGQIQGQFLNNDTLELSFSYDNIQRSKVIYHRIIEQDSTLQH